MRVRARARAVIFGLVSCDLTLDDLALPRMGMGLMGSSAYKKPNHETPGQPSKAPARDAPRTHTSHIFSKIRGASASFISSGRSSEAQKAALERLEAASAMP